MTKLTAGTVIVARYELAEQVTYQDADVKVWHAKDKIFNRNVNLFSVADFPSNVAADALERAREAAQISVAGIARVLDVLDSGSTKVIITERPQGVSGLTAISGSTFAVDQARAVTATIAKALAKAHDKGLNHGALSAQSLWFDGAKITVDGLVARHILQSNAGLPAQKLVQQDIIGLSALLYFMLTGVTPTNLDTKNELPRLQTVVPRVTPEIEQLSTGILNGTRPVPACLEEFISGLGQWSEDDLPVIDPGMLTDVVDMDQAVAVPPLPPQPVQRESIRTAMGAKPGSVPPAPSVETPPVFAPVSIAPAGAAVPAFGALAQDIPHQATPPVSQQAPVSAASAPSKYRFNPTALILIVAFVGIIWGGVWAVNTLTADFAPITVSPTGRPSPNNTAGGEDDGTKPSEETKPAEVVLPVIKAATALDPQGDGNEHPELQDLLFDGDSSRGWYSRTYKTPEFSGLKKGMGIELKLEKAAEVSSVLVSSANKGGMVEIRATTADKPTEGEVLASGPLDGETVFKLSKPITTDSLVLWFTLLPKDKDDKNRFYIHEIGLT